MALSKSKNKKNIAKRKAKKLKELRAEQNHAAVVISAMTNVYENRLNEYLNKTNDISTINKGIS